ncbi:NADPH oxidase organizer 1 isoform X2 [Hemicordylus capensis]|uniref:NADPH oxidase organizer 1 isoform X2 n=1 Tax=Hemicordylus capensis TaxID=884348 RepID=UPI0023028477|nr:NADPH oxidase organizer 1 isoform X2 [Hemicordylus capensis]
MGTVGEIRRCLHPVPIILLSYPRHLPIYMLSVSWSDQNNVLIYRTLKEFKKLHKELKRKFPIESGLLKRSDRTIPKLRDPKWVLRKNQDLNRSMKRLQLLETYCWELLKAEAKISQGEDVIHFFEAQSQDLDPSFPENSVIILPSAAGERKKEAAGPPSPTITQPLISQSYRCMEAFETKDTQNRPFRAAKEEMLEVLMKDTTGWWLVENDGKQIAWFPAPYLEIEAAAACGGSNDEGLLYCTTRAYEAKKPDELSVNVGAVVEVLEKSDDGWWLVWYNRNAGYVPSMFLQPYRNPHSRFLALAKDHLFLSTPNLSEAPSPASQGGHERDALQACPPNDTWERQDTPPSRIRSQSLAGDLAAASSGLAIGAERSSDHSGNSSKQGSSWPQKLKVKRMGHTLLTESFQHNLGSQVSLSSSLESKKRSDSGFESSLDCLENLPCSSDLEPALGGPRVPPRPLPHEILQRCTTITKRAMQGALPRSDLPACTRGSP